MPETNSVVTLKDLAILYALANAYLGALTGYPVEITAQEFAHSGLTMQQISDTIRGVKAVLYREFQTAGNAASDSDENAVAQRNQAVTDFLKSL